MTDDRQYVLVTTAHRGVFAGLLVEDGGDVVGLAQARNCIYWPRETKGFLGLATTGPSSEARVGPAVEALVLRSVTAVARCSDEARKAWEAAPWSS